MQRRRNPFRGRTGGAGGARVIELGAGTGLLGLVVPRTFPVAEVVLTDKLGSLDLLRFNAEKNCVDAWRDGKVRMDELMWGAEKRAQELGTFDVIVVADCVSFSERRGPEAEGANQAKPSEVESRHARHRGKRDPSRKCR
ncbi:hypothetical protein M427DRAFT_332102 [Gonapodya prolifera JEL478]|uniref:Calmodulin-lysine N-methyltransferase n=1 Tax=Gonapodya prolifera (strain JEL478) TaxID=1344416 RepID=A0A139ADT3_GONPJ|nr:hypothetical protein M427DRAFT_332102 [Gonapodya prolifera JEL478]|eukprot:KXS14918.1 hypothetical protein M427DRAFT_332102 [Gonapodya prolifera JEL478]